MQSSHSSIKFNCTLLTLVAEKGQKHPQLLYGLFLVFALLQFFSKFVMELKLLLLTALCLFFFFFTFLFRVTQQSQYVLNCFISLFPTNTLLFHTACKMKTLTRYLLLQEMDLMRNCLTISVILKYKFNEDWLSDFRLQVSTVRCCKRLCG